MTSIPPSPHSPAEDVRTLTNMILSTATVLLREGNRLFKDVGITAPQFNALKLLADSATGLRPSELAAALVVDPSSVTFILKQLEKRGWLRRTDDPTDRRARLVAITEEGKVIYTAAGTAYLSALDDIARSFEPAQLHAAVEIVAPTPSAVSVARPSTSVNAYALRRSSISGNNRVARPSATGSTPAACGSNVPICPTASFPPS